MWPFKTKCRHQNCYIAGGPQQYTCINCGTYVGEHHAMAMAHETRPPLWRYTHGAQDWARIDATISSLEP